MKQRSQFAVDALILRAAAQHDFGISKASISRDLVLPYQKVNQHCDSLVNRRLLSYDSVTRTHYLTPLGRQVLSLSEELQNHYSPMNQLLAKYRDRIAAGAKVKQDHCRQTLRKTYLDGQTRLKLCVASPLLASEHLFALLDECIVQALPC